MKRKIIMFSVLSLMLLAYAAESIYAWGGATSNPSGGGSIGMPPPQPPIKGPAAEAKEEVRWILQSVLDSLHVEGLIVIKYFKFDGTPINGLPNIPGVISSAKIKFGSSEGYICQFDSANNAKAESDRILAANERGDPYTWSSRRDNIVIMLDKDLPEDQASIIIDALEAMEAAR